MPNPAKAKAAQEFVPVREIRDGVMITEDNRMHMILMASSLNFALRSSDEQEAITAQYQNFLNAVDFSVQIVIQSRHLNIEPYLAMLREAERAQSNELLKLQTREYVEFIRAFVQTTKVVSKNFYVVVTFVPTGIEAGKGLLAGLFGGLKKNGPRMDDAKFEEYRSQLWQRVETVSGALSSTGVRTVPLNTEELIELLYGYFNPGELERGNVPQMQT